MEHNLIKVRNAKMEDFNEIYFLEQKAYKAGDEDVPEHIVYRIKYANPYFLVFYNTKKQIVGYINSIVTFEKNYDKNLLNKNSDDGTTLCIHSFVIDNKYRGKGLGKQIFKFYINLIKTKFTNINLIILISKQELAETFYNKFGFIINRIIIDEWYELKLELL
jgi:predicted GNAT family N-acyltransferase